VAFDGGGSITTVADTNDIGFIAVRVPEGIGVEPGIYFRVELADITGHQQFAKDSGVLVTPDQCVAVAAAIIRVFVENGDRTNRKRARLKYVIRCRKTYSSVPPSLAAPEYRHCGNRLQPRSTMCCEISA
jgi:ferredoxin-nitrite reductase